MDTTAASTLASSLVLPGLSIAAGLTSSLQPAPLTAAARQAGARLRRASLRQH